MTTLFNKRGANSLGIVGIITIIILFELLVGYFVYAINEESIQTKFNDACDCGYIGGCSGFVAFNGVNALIEKCASQTDTSNTLSDSLTAQFFGLQIIGIIFIVLNLILALVVILIIRGISE